MVMCTHVSFLLLSFFQVDDNTWTSETVQYNFTVIKEEFPDSDPKYISKYVVSAVGPAKCVLIKRGVLLFQEYIVFFVHLSSYM